MHQPAAGPSKGQVPQVTLDEQTETIQHRSDDPGGWGIPPSRRTGAHLQGLGAETYSGSMVGTVRAPGAFFAAALLLGACGVNDEPIFTTNVKNDTGSTIVLPACNWFGPDVPLNRLHRLSEARCCRRDNEPARWHLSSRDGHQSIGRHPGLLTFSVQRCSAIQLRSNGQPESAVWEVAWSNSIGRPRLAVSQVLTVRRGRRDPFLQCRPTVPTYWDEPNLVDMPAYPGLASETIGQV